MEIPHSVGIVCCFDLGKVLVRICDSWTDAFGRAGLQHIGEGLDARMQQRDTAPAFRAQIGADLHALERGEISPAEFCERGAKLLGCSPEEVMRSVEVFVHGAYPGAVALLDDLTLRGVTLACLSNTNLRHWEIMSAWNAPEDAVMSRINVRLGSHEVASRKPDPEVYRQLELATGASRDRIVFFDDLADNVAAANARGWRAFQVTSKDDPISQIRAQLVALEIL